MHKAETWGGSIDPTCSINICECGEEVDLFITDAWIIRCPKCNRGYFTEFVIWALDPNEKHPELEEEEEFMKKVHDIEMKYYGQTFD